MAGRDDDDDFVERYVACSRLHTPRPKRRSGGVNGSDSDAARMRKLFDVIKTQRDEAEWTWADVIAMLEQSQVRRWSGKPWSLSYVRGLYQREANRRAGRGTWRVSKRERADGAVAAVGHATGGGDGGGAPGGTHVVAGIGGQKMAVGGSGVGGAVGAARAGTAGPEGTGGGDRLGGEGVAAGEAARAERAPAGMGTGDGEARATGGLAADQGMGLRPVEERMSLRPRPRAARGVSNQATAPAPLPVPATAPPIKPRRDWTVMDDFEFWGVSPSGGALRGPPAEWDGVSVWDPDDKAWKPPDGIVLLP